MNPVLRRATPDDLPGVLDAFLACWRISYRGVLPAEAIDAMTDETAASLWRRVLADPVGEVLVACSDGEIAGITRFAMHDGEGVVHSLYVDPRVQGGGLGTVLLSAATENLQKAGATAAVLWVFAANAAAIGFYESQGWHADGATRTQMDFGQPEQRMRRVWL